MITIGVLLWAGNEAGGAALNGVAALISMFFLYSYGMINLAAFLARGGAHWSYLSSRIYPYFGVCRRA